MGAVQTVYNKYFDTGRAGQLVNTAQVTVVGREIETAAIGFGVPVAQGIADMGVHKVAVGDTAVIGVTLIDRTIGAEVEQYPVGSTAGVVTIGSIWVTANEVTVAGDPVYVLLADGTFKKSAAGAIPIIGARYDTSGAIGALVQVRLGAN